VTPRNGASLFLSPSLYLSTVSSAASRHSSVITTLTSLTQTFSHSSNTLTIQSQQTVHYPNRYQQKANTWNGRYAAVLLLPKHGNTSCAFRDKSVKSSKSSNAIDINGTARRGERSVTVWVNVPVIPFTAVSTIPPLLHNHFSVTGMKSRRMVGKFNVVSEIEKRCVGTYCNCCSFKGGHIDSLELSNCY